MPIVPATWEAEAEGSLEPRKRRFQCQDQATALQPGNRQRLVSKKKKWLLKGLDFVFIKGGG